MSTPIPPPPLSHAPRVLLLLLVTGLIACHSVLLVTADQVPPESGSLSPFNRTNSTVSAVTVLDSTTGSSDQVDSNARSSLVFGFFLTNVVWYGFLFFYWMAVAFVNRDPDAACSGSVSTFILSFVITIYTSGNEHTNLIVQALFFAVACLGVCSSICIAACVVTGNMDPNGYFRQYS